MPERKTLNRTYSVGDQVPTCPVFTRAKIKSRPGILVNFASHMQEIEIWPYEQMVYAQPRICPGKWDIQTPLGFWGTNGSPNLGQTTRPYNNKRKKKKRMKTCRIVDFAVPADHRVKLKESEKKDKYLDLARELKKLEHLCNDYTNCNWCSWYCHKRIDTETGGLRNKRTSGDHPNYWLTEIARILRWVLETWEDLLSLKLQWKTIS